MSILENIFMALQSIKAHKMRSVLTMLGVIIGVAAVIIVVAIGQGGEAMLTAELAGEDNTIEVFYVPTDDDMMDPNFSYSSVFTLEDIKNLQDIPEVKNVVTSSYELSPVRYRTESFDARVTGVNEGYLQVYSFELAEGVSFTQADFFGARRTAIISKTVEEELFPDEESAVGEIIRIGQQPVEVIGVLEPPSGMFAFGSNEVFLPWSTWRAIFMKSDVSQLTLQANHHENLQVVGEKAAEMLNRTNNKEDAYQVMNYEELADMIGSITGIMTMIIGGIAGISLLVGGIGVMNIMLVSVTERTREIGIRKALGATRGQILFQFLVESVILTLIGGMIGILLGIGVSSLVSFFAGWPSLVSVPVIIGGLLFSMFIGIIFGLLPASKASKLDPIDSLRYE
ncbi:ABC transporter permease [Alkalihalobacillus sp. LMS39]|uniref:ABC transporter permease n=1 Tax=Alkalihalobacillus sp. LMS39 TaxID=2924032 RepID=UPI001FB491F5|nr:ABC transporter permease [Alkalihalobacillus sp. LMS39]UOE92201.1 ABC transporter permease [Alkalihalobacillus sp. LMS39]